MIRNYKFPTIHNEGFLGGKIENRKAYNSWFDLYNKNINIEGICDNWKNYKNFEKWFEENYNPKLMKGWKLYSRLLETGECGENNTYFLPDSIAHQLKKTKGYFIDNRGYITSKFLNKHLGYFGTIEEAIKEYKKIKKQYIINKANKYREKLPNKVYNKIINYEVLVNQHQE